MSSFIYLGCAIEVPCDLATICPTTTAEFICTVHTNFALTWIIPATDSNDQLTIQSSVASLNQRNETMGIYNALALEGNVTYVTSKLTFAVPLELNNDNKEIICAQGSGSNQNDYMICPFIIQGADHDRIIPSLLYLMPYLVCRIISLLFYLIPCR